MVEWNGLGGFGGDGGGVVSKMPPLDTPMVDKDGKVTIPWSLFFQPEPPMPTYADEAAALAAGLTKGTKYQTATGEVRVKL